MKTRNKKQNKKRKTRKIIGGNIISYALMSNEGFNASLIIPNIPFISNELITKIGKKEDIINEYNSYQIIKLLNNNQDEYEKMLIKVLCNPQPIMFKIDFDLLDSINKNKELFTINKNPIQIQHFEVKPEYTHGLTIKKGEISLLSLILSVKHNILFNILNDIKNILISLNELNKHKYIHGDIKLNNILLFNQKFYLIDLGTFIIEQQFIIDATENKNKLSIFLEHLPYECQYINNNSSKLLIIETFNLTIDLYVNILYPYFKYTQQNQLYYETKIYEDINKTIHYTTNNPKLFIKKIFDTIDVFSIGLTIIQILNKYIELLSNTEKKLIFQLYELLINEVYTYNIENRITMDEFIIKYNNIII